MSQLAEAAGSPLPVKFGGKTYLLSPLTIGDMGTLERAAEDAAVDTANARLKRLSDAGVTDQAQKTQILDALNAELESGRTMGRYLIGFDGAAMMVWLSVRHEQTTVTLEEVKEKLTWIDMQAIQRKVEAISTPERTRPDPNPPAPPETAGDRPTGQNSPTASATGASTPGT